MNILITGIAGFVGSYLAEHIHATQPEWVIHGTRLPEESTQNIDAVIDSLHIHAADITDAEQVKKVIAAIRPEIVFHLAAQSYVRTSWESPQATITTNIVGQINLLEAIRSLKTDTYNPTVIIAGSSEEYGPALQTATPISENAPLRPLSPYAISKIGQDFLGFQYHQTYGLNTIRLRVFNHTGPRRPLAFGDSAIAHAIALIETGQQEPVISYRDLSAVRDYSDVRDIVRAYVAAAAHCTPGEVYNLCSGVGTSIKEMYEQFLSLSTVRNIRLIPDPQGPRPTDGGTIIGDNSRFRAATGWHPEIDFLKTTVPDILNWWRAHINIHERVHT